MPIKKTLTGHCLSYTCPKCGDALRGPLSEAGTQQSCPKCGTAHTVPGKEQVAEFLAAEKERKAEKESARQAAIQRREAKQEEQRRREQAVAEDAARGRRWQRQADAEQQQQDEPIDYRATHAMCVGVFGAGLLFYFAFMHTVTAPDSQLLNMGLLQDRLIGCHVGLGLLCAGLVMWGLCTLPREK